MAEKLTIKDIAQRCGVSITTVSRVLNNRDGSCSKETQQRIWNAINELNYRPSSIARSLVTKRTYTIALIIPDVCNPFFPELARGAEDGCNQLGYNLLLCNTDGNTKKENDYLSHLSQDITDGIIITTQNTDDENPLLATIANQHFPIVTIERYDSTLYPAQRIVFDNFSGAKSAIYELHRYGHRRIAILLGPLSASNALLRMEGYRQAMEELGLEQDFALIRQGDYKMQSGYDCTKQLLNETDFTALCASNDLMAIGACKALHETGKKIPQEISVIGFDGISLTSINQPPLLSVVIPAYEMGKTAAELLVKRINGESPSEPVRFSPALNNGESVSDVIQPSPTPAMGKK